MTDLAIPLSGIDALHAHFAEWVRFLDAKGIELEAQLAKLEARKAKADLSDAASSSGSHKAPDGPGFLELAFGEQAKQTGVDSPLPAAYVEPTAPAEMPSADETAEETAEQNEPAQDPSKEIGNDPEAEPVSSALETPEPVSMVIPITHPEAVDLV